MLMERGRQISDLYGNHSYGYGRFCGDYDRAVVDQAEGYRERSPPMSSAAKLLTIASPASSPPSSDSSSPLPSIFSPDAGFIEHRVSKFDTLAGIAIMYGVEVADIKKMNGLATDLQMFALKTLQIPLPGRHPPSPCLSNGSATQGESSPGPTPRGSQTLANDNLFDSFQSLRLKPSNSKVSSAMSLLQGYYGLQTTDKKAASDGSQKSLYKNGCVRHSEDDSYLKPYPPINPPLNRHRKSRSLVNALTDNNDISANSAGVREKNSDKQNEKLLRRRQKSEADFTSRAQQKLTREDNSNSRGFSSVTGKNLAQRPKAASKISLVSESEMGGLNPLPINLMDSFFSAGSSGVRKSSSASSLQDPDGNISNNSSPIWPTSTWSLKPDLLSTAAITSSILEGLPKPLTGRKNKAALD